MPSKVQSLWTGDTKTFGARPKRGVGADTPTYVDGFRAYHQSPDLLQPPARRWAFSSAGRPCCARTSSQHCACRVRAPAPLGEVRASNAVPPGSTRSVSSTSSPTTGTGVWPRGCVAVWRGCGCVCVYVSVCWASICCTWLSSRSVHAREDAGQCYQNWHPPSWRRRRPGGQEAPARGLPCRGACCVRGKRPPAVPPASGLVGHRPGGRGHHRMRGGSRGLGRNVAAIQGAPERVG